MEMPSFYICLLLVTFAPPAVWCQNTVQIDSSSGTVSVASGDTAQLECKVKNLQSGQEVVWFFVDHNQTIATGNSIRVTNYDNKYTIYRPQDSGEYDYWNLQISLVQLSDVGTYKCYIKGLEDTVRVIYHLQLQDGPGPIDAPNVNVTDCCVAQGVELCALPMCDTSTSLTVLLNIVANDACMEKNLVKVLTCGQDGRNHLGCCIRSGLSDLCQDLCSPYVEKPALDYSSCIGIPTLSLVKCFKEGQLLLPSQPTGVSAANMGTSVMVSWQPPVENANLTTGYKIQYREKGADHFNTTQVLSKTYSSWAVQNLNLNTVYEIQVIAIAAQGSSQPSQALLISTGEVLSSDQLADSVAKCCVKQNVTTPCRQYCNVSILYMGGHPNAVLECYSEVDIIYQCLAGHGNHTPCCQRVQVPDTCLNLCQGIPINTWDIVQCLSYMPLIASCMVEGSVALPDPPQQTRIVGGSVTPYSAVVEWEPPSRITAGQFFMVNWKEAKDTLNNWTSVEVFNGTQYKLTGLRPATLYDIVVVSVNEKGSSLPELTLELVTEDVPATIAKPFNETECCMDKGVTGECLQLCVHQFRLTDQAILVGLKCVNAIEPMLLCGTDGRDHTLCCREREIPDSCLGLCSLQPGVTPSTNFIQCAAFKDDLTTCFDEGKAVLPRAPSELSVKSIDMFSITIDWNAPSGPNVTQYIVEFSMDNIYWMKKPNTTQTFMKIDSLQQDSVYYFRVTSVNDNGQSVPSNILVAYTLPAPTNKTQAGWEQLWHNRSDCCMNSNISTECQSACENMEEFSARNCAADMDKIVACGADGRDHTECCKRFPGFPEVCLPYCRGQPGSRDLLSALCLTNIAPILTCFTDGQGLLPTPPTNVRAVPLSGSEIVMQWGKPTNNCDDQCSYVTYIWVDDSKNLIAKNKTDSMTHTFTGLTPETKYRVSVASVNNKGMSLPSPYTIIFTPSETQIVAVSQAPSGIVDSGTPVQLECVGLGGDLQNVSWVRNSQVVSKTNTYRIDAVSDKDSGWYMCNVTFADGKVKDKGLFLNVKYKPQVNKMVESTVLPGVGQHGSLSCEFTGFPDFVAWTKDDINLAGQGAKFYLPPPQVDLSIGKTVSTLTIRYVESADFGQYTCNGTNLFGSMHATGALRNMFPVTPPPTSAPPNKTTFAECCSSKGIPDDCTRHVCTYTVDINTITGNAELTHCLAYLTDFFACGADGKDHTKCCTEQGIKEDCLPFCRGVVPDYNHPLELLQCMPFADKLLTCAENGQQYIPSQPKSVMVMMQYDTVKVSWELPEKNSEKVDVYYIHYKSQTVSETQDAASPQSRSKTLQADLIKRGEKYSVWVIAKNDFGSSDISNIATITIQKLLPPAPTNLHADVIAGVNIDVKWTPPNTPVKIVKYAVRYAPKGGVQRIINPIGQQTSTRLVNLQENTVYIISVAAYSQDGEGEVSHDISIATGFVQGGGGTSQPQTKSDNVVVEAVVGTILGIVLLLAVILVALLLFRRMKAQQSTKTNGQTVSFENPQYGGEQRVTGLPEGTETPQFGYGKLHEENDVEQPYVTLETGHNSESTDTPATLNVGQA